jgi:hypothetical protein
VSTQVSPQIKILAAVGLVLALVLGASMKLMGHSSSTSSTSTTAQARPHSLHPHTTPTAAPAPVTHAAGPKHSMHPKQSVHAPAATTAVKTPPTAQTRHAAKPVPATKPVAASKPAAATHAAKAKTAKAKRVKVVPEVAANGLPGVLDELLHLHGVVVVALWDPEIPSDRIALNEAEAGAKSANAGFLAVNVLNDRVATPLTAVAGSGTILPSPGVLIYRQPALLVNKIEGFADRDAVAQAVADALLIDPATVAAASAAAAAAAAGSATPAAPTATAPTYSPTTTTP